MKMKKKNVCIRFLYILFFLLITVLVRCGEIHSDNGNWQYWNAEAFSWNFNSNWSFTLYDEFRFNSNSTGYYYNETDISVSYRNIMPWLNLSVSYCRILSLKSDQWKLEKTILFDKNINFNLNDLGVSDRNRFEYRTIEDSDNHWRYRNKLTLKKKIKLISRDVYCYTADEIFINLKESELNANRFYVGISTKLYKNLNMNIYYLIMSSKTGTGWVRYNIPGTVFKLAF